MTHVDDWIRRAAGSHDPKLQYAACAMLILRLPATERMAFGELIRLPLYCDRNGVRVRVVSASRMGDIGITANLESDKSEDLVSVDECENWIGHAELVNSIAAAIPPTSPSDERIVDALVMKHTANQKTRKL